jgi:glutamine amidotransferase-like uncharacterized protein
MARPLALVYRGPASVPGCPEAVADLLARSSWNFEIAYVGPRESSPLTADVLSRAALYAQPGGGTLGKAYRRLRKQAGAIRDFVGSGGRYLGFCLGGYLAGETPGFGLLPGDTDQYVASRGAGTTTDEDTILRVRWGNEQREVFFQDGPYFTLDPARGPAQVLAAYDNGLPAAVVAPFGRGAVGVVGPHPEATPDWFTDAGLPLPRRPAVDLGLDLIERTMLA